MSSVGETLRRPWLREIAVVVALYFGYSLARVFANDDKRIALHNATELLHFERLVGLDTERSWNALLITHDWLTTFSAYWYATMHYVATPIMLYLLWRKSRPLYRRMRWALVGSTVLALAGYLFFPTAPPRMMSGYVDVMAQTAHVGWWGSSASAPEGLGGLTNELAAMPSMHVGWAVWCSLALLVLGNKLWHRAASVTYTAVTTIVVVATANHWLIDAVAGAAIVVFFFGVFSVVPRIRAWQNSRATEAASVTELDATAEAAVADATVDSTGASDPIDSPYALESRSGLGPELEVTSSADGDKEPAPA